MLIHEISRFAANGGTQDLGFGREICTDHATNNPRKAVKNANNYTFFAYNPDRLG